MDKFVFTELKPQGRNDPRHLWIANDGAFSVYLCHPNDYHIQVHCGTFVRKGNMVGLSFITDELTVANLIAMDIMEQFMYHRPRDRNMARDVLSELVSLYHGVRWDYDTCYIAPENMSQRLRHPKVMPTP